MSGTAAATEALQSVAEAFRRDLPDLFGHEDVEVATGPAEVVAVGAAGRARVTWPYELEVEGELGEHARIALEFLMAAAEPHEFWPEYRPPHPDRRRAFFDAVHGYVDEVLGDIPYFQPLTVAERDAAVLVCHGDEYAIVSDHGNHRGEGVLHWKVKRLVAYALTDVM